MKCIEKQRIKIYHQNFIKTGKVNSSASRFYSKSIKSVLKKSFTRIGVTILNSIPLSVKTLNVSNFRKKDKITTP